MSKGFGKTIGRRIRIRQSDDASASCSGSSQLDPPSASSACTVRFTTPFNFQRHLISRSTLRIFRAEATAEWQYAVAAI
jgi:hypothetical protein